ncbi:MAG: hypothetical protein LLF89_04340 [Spirochaetaceae bacterium]|nr:hypothetical protein [Spirochaetaceae bacterium]
MKTKAKKVRILLESVKRLFDAGEFSWQKRLYKISQAGIVEALNTVSLRNFDTPLTNHNYLKTVMVTIAEREEKESARIREKKLREKEEGLRNAHRDPDDNLSYEENRQRLKGVLEVLK